MLTITNNLVYSATKSAELSIEKFISDLGFLDEELALNKSLNYKILLINNTYTAPEHLINYLSNYDCTWLPKTATNSSIVYEKVVEN